MTDLGPNTEARFARVFGKRALATASDAADLLGVDVETLNALSDANVIRAVRPSKCRRWTEADLRAYILEGPDAPLREKKRPPVAASGRCKVVPFTQRRRTPA